MLKLWLNFQNKTWPFDLKRGSEVSIGRGPNNHITIQDKEISRIHCRLAFHSDSELKLHDVGSTNGCYVNGVRVEKAFLVPGDLLQVGNSRVLLTKSDQQTAPKLLSSKRSQKSKGSATNLKVATQRTRVGSFHIRKSAEKPPSTVQPVAKKRFGSNKQMQKLISFCQSVAGELELRRLLELVLDSLVTLTQAGRGLLLLVDDSGGVQVDLDYQYPEAHCDLKTKSFLKSLIANVQDAGHLIVNSAQTVNSKNPMVRYVCIPLATSDIEESASRRKDDYEDRIYGYIYLDRFCDDLPKTIDPDFLKIFGVQAGLALQNAYLYRLATTDPLTKLLNRDSFFRLLDREVAHAAEHNLNMALIMVDLDKFKNVNDDYGHMTGDEVLRESAIRLKDSLRRSDLLGRYGGEEFVVALPRTSQENAVKIVNKLRMRLSETPISEFELTITASFGIAMLSEHSSNQETLLNLADQALYAAKEGGRNRAVVWSSDLERSLTKKEPQQALHHGELLTGQQYLGCLVKFINTLASDSFSVDRLSTVLDNLIDALRADRAILFCGESYEKQLPIVRCTGPVQQQLEESFYFQEAVDFVFQQRVAVKPDLLNSEENQLSVTCLPLKLDQQIYGVLYIEADPEFCQFSNSDFAFLDLASQQIALYLKAHRGKFSDSEDPSTGRQEVGSSADDKGVLSEDYLGGDTEIRVSKKNQRRRSSGHFFNDRQSES